MQWTDNRYTSVIATEFEMFIPAFPRLLESSQFIFTVYSCLGFLNGKFYVIPNILNLWRRPHFTKPSHRTAGNKSYRFCSVSKMTFFSPPFLIPRKYSRNEQTPKVTYVSALRNSFSTQKDQCLHKEHKISNGENSRRKTQMVICVTYRTDLQKALHNFKLSYIFHGTCFKVISLKPERKDHPAPTSKETHMFLYTFLIFPLSNYILNRTKIYKTQENFHLRPSSFPWRHLHRFWWNVLESGPVSCYGIV